MSLARARLKSGDIFLLTYSGHGGQVPDPTGEEPDGFDKSIQLLIDFIQSPNYFKVGFSNPAFERQRPFTV